MSGQWRRPPLFIALMPGLDSLQGHQHDYGRAVQLAVSSLAWDYRAAVPSSAAIGRLPAGWSAALDRGQYRFTGNAGAKLSSIWRLGRSARAFLQAVRPGDQPAILFIEFFNYVQLMSLLVTFWRQPHGALSLWLVYRLPVHRGTERFLYRALTIALRRQLGPRGVTLFTDSALLVGPLSQLFGQAVHLLPVPHGVHDLPASARQPVWSPAEARPECVAWWPGRPTTDKGLARIQRLAQDASPAARRATLVLAEGAAVSAGPNGCTVRFLPKALEREAYWGWVHEADLVLLPYDAKMYRERTSGIFVEAIAAGKLAPTSAGTWMAGEAVAHGLPELIIDWDQPGVWERLLALWQAGEVRPRLERMAAHYRQEHNPAKFAAVLRRAWETAG